ncbi:MFS transporter [Candidatus Bathyarchaeota archaeon]|nr:MFS transporter [Candidatus Bathyarchaeota archaeon]
MTNTFRITATIFESAGIADPIMMQLILGAINVGMTFPGLWFVERFGRRWPMIIGAAWQGAWMIVFASVGITMNPESNPQAGVIMIVAAAMFIASFACTWGPFCWVVIAESFPLRTRAKQASLATAGNWIGNCKLTHVQHDFSTDVILTPLDSPHLPPHPLRQRRHLVRLRLRLRRLQRGGPAHRLLLPVRARGARPRERGPHVQRQERQGVEVQVVEASGLHHPRGQGRGHRQDDGFRLRRGGEEGRNEGERPGECRVQIVI